MTIAREGSVRIPGKNMKMICGKPLLEWTLLQIVNTKYIAHYWLVTDSEEQAKLGESYGFKIVWQPKEEIEEAQKHDRSGGPYAFRRGLEAAQKWGVEEDPKQKGPFDVFVPLLPTMPLRKPNEVDDAIDLWLANQHTHVRSCSNLKDMMMFEHKEGMAVPYMWDHDGKFCEGTGNIMVSNPLMWMQHNFKPDGTVLTWQEMMDAGAYLPWPQEFWQRYDIDYPEDFDLVEYFLEKNILKGRGASVYTDYKDWVLSEFGFEQHAANYNKGVEMHLLPSEYRNSFFNHFPVYLECLKSEEAIKGWELVEIRDDGKGLRRQTVKYVKARNGSDVFDPVNVLKEKKPALIVGSGPSLDAAMPYIKDWKGGVFCSSSQASTLIHYGCDPTYVVAYDINTTPDEFKGVDTWKGRDTVLITHPGMFPATIENWHGRRMYFKSMDTSNFFFTNVLPVAYGDVIPSQMFLFSCSVAAQMSLAHALGYGPLFFVGCDFLADRFHRWHYDHEKKDWVCDYTGYQNATTHKALTSKAGKVSDPLQIFYKRSTLCVWRIDHSPCIQTSNVGVIEEMPYVPIEDVMKNQGLGFEDKLLTNEQIDDVTERYMAHFNQFVLRFEPGANGRESYRILESHQKGDWDADVSRYIAMVAEGLKQQHSPLQIDIAKNMARFREVKKAIEGERSYVTHRYEL
jgi:CMP-N-acetylneuraminic acid synthetase